MRSAGQAAAECLQRRDGRLVAEIHQEVRVVTRQHQDTRRCRRDSTDSGCSEGGHDERVETQGGRGTAPDPGVPRGRGRR